MQTGCIQQVGLGFAKRLGDRELHQTMFRALCELHLEKPDEEAFTAWDLYAATGVHVAKWHKDQSLERQKELVRAHWKTLKARWPSYQRGVIQLAQQDGFEEYVVPDRIEGGGTGNVTKYRLKRVQCDQPAEAISTEFDIRYVATTSESMDWLSKKVFGANMLAGWRRYFYLSFVCMAMLGLFGLGVLGYFTLLSGSGQEIAQLLAVVVVGVGLVWLVRPFLKVIGDRQVLLSGDPFSSENNRLLEFQEPPHVAQKMLRIVTYSSECPICNSSRVTVRSGRPEKPGTLVGRCDNAPYAHVFSFDPVLLGGNRIG
jgi:hypothetical protein